MCQVTKLKNWRILMIFSAYIIDTIMFYRLIAIFYAKIIIFNSNTSCMKIIFFEFDTIKKCQNCRDEYETS